MLIEPNPLSIGIKTNPLGVTIATSVPPPPVDRDVPGELWPGGPWQQGDWVPPRPARLPALRADLMDRMDSPELLKATAYQLERGRGTVTPDGPPLNAAAVMLEEERERLRAARLYYVAGNMMETVMDAAATLPPNWSVAPHELPSPEGFVMFGNPFAEYTAKRGHLTELVKMVAMSWGPSSILSGHHYGGCWITFWSATDYDALTRVATQMVEDNGDAGRYREYLARREQLTRALRQQGKPTRSRGQGIHRQSIHDASGDIRAEIARIDTVLDNVPLAVTDPRAHAIASRGEVGWDNETVLLWGPDTGAKGLSVVGSAPGTPLPKFGTREAGTLDWSRVLLATWLLMQQEHVVQHEEQPVPRREGRQLTERGKPTSGVNVVSLQRRLRQAPAADVDQAAPAETRRRLSKISRVRTHWRNQAWGTGWSQRRRILIHKHERGPEGNGYYDTPTVEVLR